MDLSKILSNPPEEQRLIRSRQYNARYKPSELEVAHMMVSLSSSDSMNFVEERISSPAVDFLTQTDNIQKRRRSNERTKRMVASPSGLPCPNCCTETSTLWRNCSVDRASRYLCNACGLRFKKGKYCPECFQVYYDADTNQLAWKQCSVCLNWTHKKCIQNANQKEELWGKGSYTCKTCKKNFTRPGHNGPIN